jgi:hypothetical protein
MKRRREKMRKFLIPLAAAASTMAFAAPASAQWYPQPHPQPYAAPNAYGNLTPHGWGQFANVRQMQARAHQLRMHIRNLDRRNMLTRNQARSLEREARNIERQIARTARQRLNVRQYRAIEQRLVRLEMRVQHQVAINMQRQRHRHAYRWR